MHGGVAQGLSLSARYLREMALSTGAVVVAPDYRRAPAHPFPTPFDDCLAGAKYLIKHANDYNVDPQNVVLVGNSFGGQIAVSMALTNNNLFKVLFLGFFSVLFSQYFSSRFSLSKLFLESISPKPADPKHFAVPTVLPTQQVLHALRYPGCVVLVWPGQR